jgi:hypothetical protein
MAMRDWEHLRMEAEKLTAEQQLELAEYLIHKARKGKYVAKVVDLNKYAGTVIYPEDPLAYQNRIRAEWDR